MGDSVETMIGDLVAQEAQDGPHKPQTCPDGGFCGHRCGEICWRSIYCVPLSGYGDSWPADSSPVPEPAAV